MTAAPAPVVVASDPRQVTFRILVAARASNERFGPVAGDRVRVAVHAPPIEGKANAAVVALISRVFAVHRSDVAIVAGERGRRKTVRVQGRNEQDLGQLLSKTAASP